MSFSIKKNCKQLLRYITGLNKTIEVSVKFKQNLYSSLWLRCFDKQNGYKKNDGFFVNIAHFSKENTETSINIR